MRPIAVLVSLLGVAGALSAAEPTPTPIGSQHELLLDRNTIVKTEHVSLSLIPAQRTKANPVLVADKPWEMQGCVGCPSVVYDPQRKIFRMWYLVDNVWLSRHRLTETTTTSSKPTTTTAASIPVTTLPTSLPANMSGPMAHYGGQSLPNTVGAIPMADSSFICYAESADGTKWTKPELNLLDFQGSKKNNIVLRHSGSHLGGFSVLVRHEWSKPEERYVLIAHMGTWPGDPGEAAKRGLKYALPAAGDVAFTSADGIRFKPVADKPVLARPSSRGRAAWSWDAARKRFVGCMPTEHEGRLARAQVESEDLRSWSKPRLILASPKDDGAKAAFTSHLSFPMGSQLAAWLEVVRPDMGKPQVQVASSRDGRTWHRVGDRKPLLAPGADGTFDAAGVRIGGTPPVPQGKDLWIYYEAAKPHPVIPGVRQTSIAMAAVRVDGVMAAVAGEKEGLLVTKPLSFNGGRLFLNADVAKGGHIRAALGTPDGKPVAGFEAAKAIPVTSGGVNVPATWNGDPALPAKKPLRLMFHMKSAKLYAYWCH